MRPVVLLSLFLTVAAQAQDREPAFLPRAAVVTVGVAGGVGAVVGAYYLIPSWYDTPPGAALLVLSYPAGVALGTMLASEALGLDAPPGRVLTDAALGLPAGALAGLVTGGLVGWDAKGVFAKGFVAQIGQTLANIKAVVEAGGGKVEDIVRLTWYVTDIAAYRNSLAELGPVYRANFGRHFPAMAVVSVPALVEPEAMVEIEATAVLPS